MWQLLLLAAAGAGYLAKCLQISSERRIVLPNEGEKKESKSPIQDVKQHDGLLSEAMAEQTGVGSSRDRVQAKEVDLNILLSNAVGFKQYVGARDALGLQAHGVASNAGLGEGRQIPDEAKLDSSYSPMDVQASGGVSRGFMFGAKDCSSFDSFDASTALPGESFEGRSDVQPTSRKVRGLNRGRRFSGRTSVKGVSQRFRGSLQSCLNAQFLESNDGMEFVSLPEPLTNCEPTRVELTGLAGSHGIEDCNVETQPGGNVCEREDISLRATRCVRDAKGLQSSDHRSSCSELCNIEHVQRRHLGKKIVPAFQKKSRMFRRVEHRSGNSGLGGQPWHSQGGLLFSYGVGVGAMFMISSGKYEIDKLTTLLNHTVDLVQEIKRQLDARNEYSQNNKTSMACERTFVACQELGIAVDANFHVQKESMGSVGTPFQVPSENNESARSAITEEPAQQGTAMAELEAEFEAELEHMQVNMLKGNSSDHQRKLSGLSELDPESLIDVVEGELSVHGLPDHCDSADRTPSTQLENTYLDNYEVSPYELDKHLRDLLEKQQEDKISELETELKSTETKLYTKERELKWWKDQVRRLTEFSFGATSGEDSSTFERANDADGIKCMVGPSRKTSVKSVVNSEQEGNSQLSLWPFSHLEENPLESTADSPGHLDHGGKMANASSGAISLAYVKNMETTRMPRGFRASIDETCKDFLRAVADARSDMFCCYKDGTSEQSIEPELGEEDEKPSEASGSCTVLGYASDGKSEAEDAGKKNCPTTVICKTSESLDVSSSTQIWPFQNKSGVVINKSTTNGGTEEFGGPINKHCSNWPEHLDGYNVFNYNDSEGGVQGASTEKCKEVHQYASNLCTNSSKFSNNDLTIDPLVLDKVNNWKARNGLIR